MSNLDSGVRSRKAAMKEAAGKKKKVLGSKFVSKAIREVAAI
jgi:hypothetical protein